MYNLTLSRATIETIEFGPESGASRSSDLTKCGKHSRVLSAFVCEARAAGEDASIPE